MLARTRHHAGRVYVPGLEPVKRRGWRALILGVAGVTAGCAAPQRGPAAVPYLLAVSYNVALPATMDLATPTAIMRGDFAHIRKLGFDTVIARHCRDDRQAPVAQAARREGLRPAWSPREQRSSVRTGRLPRGCRAVGALVAGGRDSSRPDVVVLGGIVDADTAARAGQIAAAYRRQGGPPVTLAVLAAPGIDPTVFKPKATLTACSPEHAGEAWVGSAMLLRCVQHEGETVPEASARWLGQYHAGLAAGLTGGLIVEPFRVVPGQWRGLVEGTDRGGLDRATALRRITGRARHWGPRLRRLEPRDLRPLGPVSDSLRLVLFTGTKRRLVMLFNTSERHFIRGMVDLPSELDSGPVGRAVLVPPDPNAISRRVVQPRTGRLSMAMDLAPGDAALWELF